MCHVCSNLQALAIMFLLAFLSAVVLIKSLLVGTPFVQLFTKLVKCINVSPLSIFPVYYYYLSLIYPVDYITPTPPQAMVC